MYALQIVGDKNIFETHEDGSQEILGDTEGAVIVLNFVQDIVEYM